MAELHEALKYLGPAKWTDIPTEGPDLEAYLTDLLEHTQLVLDSVPLPAPDDAPQKPQAKPPNAATKASEVTLSSERPPAVPFGHEKFQKEWGKPLKIKAQENALGLSVYKMSGKDSRGAWFARRSIHEGIGFKKFKRSLQMEFEKSLQESGPPGTGNVRGIGGEERVEQIKTEKGNLEVYRLSAQFPGPTAARDFVTMLVTSDKALRTESDQTPARHHIMVSRPCDHPSTQPQTGFVRGFYESIEFIREVPRAIRATQSSVDLVDQKHGQKQNQSVRSHEDGSGRARASTVDDRAASTSNLPDQDEPEDNPVEWIMVTRSDPGGGIPRFLVERGTPSSICGDAVKFIDWACQNTDGEQLKAASSSRPQPSRKESHQSWKGKGLAGIDEHEQESKPQTGEAVASSSANQPPVAQTTETTQQEGWYGAIAGAAASLKAYTPQVVLNHLPVGSESQTAEVVEDDAGLTSPQAAVGMSADSRSYRSTTSFASAEDHLTSSSEEEGEESSIDSTTMAAHGLTGSSEHVNREKQLRHLDDKKQALNEKFAASRAKLDDAKAKQAEADSKEYAKAVEKHDRELKKQEAKYKKELAKIEKKQDKERKKAVERQKKLVDKDEKTRLTRERDEARQELELAKQEAASLRTIVMDLQKENTALVIKLGKAGLSNTIDLESGTRSRGSSLSRKEKKELKEKDLALASAADSVKSSETTKS